MIRFKEISQLDFQKKILGPTVTSSGFGYDLSLRFDKKERLLEARYSGKQNVWFNLLCYVIEGKSYLEIKNINKNTLRDLFGDDPLFIECFEDLELKVFHPSFELLNLALDTYKGQLRSYHPQSKIVCRCSGSTEDDIAAVIHEAESLNDLAIKSGAGLGCRSCTKQLEKFFSRQKVRRFKNLTNAEWVMKAQELLDQSTFKNLEIKSFRNGMLILSSSLRLAQLEEENLTLELQDYFEALGEEVSVFLDFSQDLK